MASLNQATIIGNVGADPEVRYISEGANGKVASFSVATKEGYKDKSDKWVETTEWHRIVAFGKLADVIEKYVRKGSPLFVQGRLRTRQWADQGGLKHTVTEIIAANIQLLSSQRPGDPAIAGARQMAAQQQVASRPASTPSYQQQNPASIPAESLIPEGGSDDLPF